METENDDDYDDRDVSGLCRKVELKLNSRRPISLNKACEEYGISKPVYAR